MRELISILFLATLSNTFAQNLDSIAVNLTNEKGQKNGKWIEQIDFVEEINSSAIAIVYYENDTLHGTVLLLDQDEKLRLSGEYRRGKKEGLAYVYNSNNDLVEILSFKQDKLCTRNLLDRYGKIYHSISYNESLNRDGQETLFFGKARKHIVKYWRNGLLFKKEIYYRNQKLKSIHLYNEKEELTEITHFKRNGREK